MIPARASAIRRKTGLHSLNRPWRNNRIDGYRGKSSWSSNHRHSAGRDRVVHVGRPMAPAEWATAESGVITKSRLAITAAVSSQVIPLIPPLRDQLTQGQRDHLARLVGRLLARHLLTAAQRALSSCYTVCRDSAPRQHENA